MRCRAALRMLPLHVGGDLDGPDRERVESHLEGCESCAAERDRYEAGRRSLFVLKGAARGPTPDLWPTVRSRIAGRSARRSRAPRVIVAAVVLASALLGGWAGLRSSETGSAPEVSTSGGGLSASPAGSGSPSNAAETAERRVRFVLSEVEIPGAAHGYEAFPSVGPTDRDRARWDEF